MDAEPYDPAAVLSDEQAIANLVLGYAEAVDRGDFDAVGAFFADATYRAAVGSDVYVLEGAAAVTEQMTAFTRRYDDGTPRTRHVTTNLIIELDDAATGATCRSSYCVLQVVAGSLQPIIVGRYHDAFAKARRGVALHRSSRPHRSGRRPPMATSCTTCRSPATSRHAQASVTASRRVWRARLRAMDDEGLPEKYRLTPRYGKALKWAAELHVAQARKGTTIPYVSHVLAVSGLVLEHGGSEDQAIAGLLHDAIEDCGVSEEEIEARFGSAVARIVAGLLGHRRGPEAAVAGAQGGVPRAPAVGRCRRAAGVPGGQAPQRPHPRRGSQA